MANRETKLNIIVDAENRTARAFNEINDGLKINKQRLEGITSAMRTVGAVGAVAFAGLSAAAFSFIKSGAEFEQTQIAFRTMIGDADKANDLLRKLSQFASSTPFELNQIEKASKQLLAYGIEVENIIPTMDMLGNIAAGVGMDKLPNLILAFGQMRAATRLTGMELRQFTEAGVPLLGELAKSLGVAESEIQDMVSNGEVSFDMARAALSNLTAEGGRFHALMASQATSLGGLWSNFKDQIELTSRAIGVELLPVLKPVVVQLIEMVSKVQEFVKEHPKLSAGILAAALAFTGLLAVMLPLSMMLPGMLIMFTAIGSVLTTSITLGAMKAALAFGIWGFAIAGVGTLLWNLYHHWEDIVDLLAVGILQIQGWFSDLWQNVVNGFIDAFNFVIDKVNSLLSKFAEMPFIGSKFKSMTIERIGAYESNAAIYKQAASDLMDELLARDGGRNVTDWMADEVMSKYFVNPETGGFDVKIDMSNSTFLDPDVAEQIGNMIISKLKLSNSI